MDWGFIHATGKLLDIVPCPPRRVSMITWTRTARAEARCNIFSEDIVSDRYINSHPRRKDASSLVTPNLVTRTINV